MIGLSDSTIIASAEPLRQPIGGSRPRPLPQAVACAFGEDSEANASGTERFFN